MTNILLMANNCFVGIGNCSKLINYYNLKIPFDSSNINNIQLDVMYIMNMALSQEDWFLFVLSFVIIYICIFDKDFINYFNELYDNPNLKEIRPNIHKYIVYIVWKNKWLDDDEIKKMLYNISNFNITPEIFNNLIYFDKNDNKIVSNYFIDYHYVFLKYWILLSFLFYEKVSDEKADEKYVFFNKNEIDKIFWKISKHFNINYTNNSYYWNEFSIIRNKNLFIHDFSWPITLCSDSLKYYFVFVNKMWLGQNDLLDRDHFCQYVNNYKQDKFYGSKIEEEKKEKYNEIFKDWEQYVNVEKYMSYNVLWKWYENIKQICNIINKYKQYFSSSFYDEINILLIKWNKVNFDLVINSIPTNMWREQELKYFRQKNADSD